jgi:hypothetical protein
VSGGKSKAEHTAEFHAKRKAAGLCIACGTPRTGACTENRCERCAEIIRVRSRNKHRARMGIPFDAPLFTHARVWHRKRMEAET